MIDRCTNERSPDWKNYGGRGIRVCERWMEVRSFVEDMGEPPSGKHTLGRIDNEGDYEPGNCRWETRAQQADNTRRSRFVEVGGERRTARGWERSGEASVDARTIRGRIAKGWSDEDAVEVVKLQCGPGELHHRAKLTRAQVLEVRRLGDAGEDWDVLADRYGVDRRTIRDVVKRITWRSVPER